MKIVMRYDVGSGPTMLAIQPSTFITWEKAHNRTTASLAENLGLADMAFLVHTQLEKNGDKPGTLDAWSDTLVDIGVEGSDPT